MALPTTSTRGDVTGSTPALRLGFFFTYWSSRQTELVAQSPPTPINCPFCGQQSDAVMKIYNAKTKHYSVLTVGKGKFYCTFTCRNCTNEGELDEDVSRDLVRTHFAGQEYDKIVALHDADPVKATRQLSDLLRKNSDLPAVAENIRRTLDEWRPGLSQSKKDNGDDG